MLNRPRRLVVIKVPRWLSSLLSTKSLASSALTILVLTLLSGFAIALVLLSNALSSKSSDAGQFDIAVHRVLGHEMMSNLSTDVVDVTNPPHAARAILMSCPVGHSDVSDGKWKPSNMARGVEAVILQLIQTNSSLPLYYAFYEHERVASEAFCRDLVARYRIFVHVFCFLVRFYTFISLFSSL